MSFETYSEEDEANEIANYVKKIMTKNKNISKKDVKRFFKNPKKELEKEKKSKKKEDNKSKVNVTYFGCYEKRHCKSECLDLKSKMIRKFFLKKKEGI